MPETTSNLSCIATQPSDDRKNAWMNPDECGASEGYPAGDCHGLIAFRELLLQGVYCIDYRERLLETIEFAYKKIIIWKVRFIIQVEKYYYL